ncbi:MAG: type II toxin-antitoxin system HicB family antitoxin [Bacteroidota bacterium]
MAKKKYTVLIERDENGWLVSDVVELYGCHTQAKTMDELLARTKEAIEGYLESERSPESVAIEFVGVQQIEV